MTTQINVTIPIDSLAGLSDTPGMLSGFGILPADQVRRLAAGDTRWRHILTDRATGAVLDVGTWSYRPPRPSTGMSAPATSPAGSPAAPSPPGNATSTTWSPFPKAQPARRICTRSADGITD